MKIKRLLSIFFIVIFVCTIGVVSVSANTYNDFEYYIRDTIIDNESVYGVVITGYTGSEKTVTIPSTIDGVQVIKIGSYAFQSNQKITSITIPDSVKSVGYGAFSYCEKLQSVSIGSGVIEIDNYAFNGCSALTSITIPNSVKSVGDGAFFECIKLKTVSIGNGVSEIGNYAFYGCSALTSIEIPDSVKSIGYRAFDGCAKLQSISIGSGVSEIGDYAFGGCDALASFTVSSANKKYSSSSGVLFNKKQTTLIKYPPAKSGDSYVIPKSVTSIDDNAFGSTVNLKYIGILYDFKYDIPYNVLQYSLFTCDQSIADKFNKKYPWNTISNYGSSLSLLCSSSTSSTINVKVSDAPKIPDIRYKYYLYDSKAKKYELYKTTTGISCKFSDLDAGTAYKIKVVRYVKKDDSWVKTDAAGSFTVATTLPGSSPNNKAIDAGAKASVTSKKLTSNTYLYTPGYFYKWENPSPISQFTDKNGNVMFAYANSNGQNLLIKKLKDNLTATKVASIKTKLDMAGTVVGDDKGYFYVVWARRYCSSQNQTAITVTKYDSSWKEVKSVSYTSKEIDTVDMFAAGNCDAAVSNGVFYFLYSKKMYNGHQRSDQLVIQTSNMSKISSPLSFWCSHSFGQRVIIDHNGDPWYANHGDCYPRAFQVTSKNTSEALFHFYCNSADRDDMYIVNETNAQLGGLADTSKDIFLVGCSVKSMQQSGYNSQPRNLFITSAGGHVTLSNSSSRSGTVFGEKFTDKNIKWLTNYSSTYTVMNPQVVSTDDDRIIVMWEKINRKTGSFVDSYYMILTANGKVYQKALSMNKQRLNKNETPIYKDGCVYWINADFSKISVTKLNVDKISFVKAMSGVKVASRGVKQVKLSWTKNTSATGYQIQVQKDGKWTTVATVTKNSTTSCTIKNLSAGTMYNIRIRAYKTVSGTKFYGAFKTISVVTKPGKVSEVTLKEQTKTSLTVQWSKIKSATGYQVQIQKNGKWVSYDVSSGSTLYTFKNLSKNQSYSIRIRAYKTIDKTKYYGAYKTVSYSTAK